MEMIESGNAGKLLVEALTKSNNPFATSGGVFKDVPQWAKAFAAVEAHEREHVRRVLSTTWGIFCHALRSQQLNMTCKMIAQESQNASPLHLHLLPNVQGELAASVRRVSNLQQAIETKCQSRRD
jgi:hypothetical protein